MVIGITLYIYNYDGYMMVCYTNHLCTNSDSATIMIYNMRLNCHIIPVRSNIPTNISILCRHKSMVVLQIIISIIKRKQHYPVRSRKNKKTCPHLEPELSDVEPIFLQDPTCSQFSQIFCFYKVPPQL